jgi:RNA polymerase sigma factor (TIGR02999 family)
VYDELRRLAAQRLAREAAGQTLQSTALVHEAYLRLVGGEHDRVWNGRSHFLAAAAEAMRHILVDNARRKNRKKRGGERRWVDLADPPSPEPDDDILALNDALDRLANEDPVAVKVVELHQLAASATRTQPRRWGFPSILPARSGRTPAHGSAMPLAADRAPRSIDCHRSGPSSEW